MAISAVKKYDQFEGLLLSNATKQWDDPAAGAFMWCIADKTYTPSTAHTVSFDLAGVITTGDGAPINITNRTIDYATTVGKTFLKSDNADFGAVVTITGKYIVCIQPAVAGAFDGANDKVMFYFDLDNASGTAERVVVNDEFIYTLPPEGWIALRSPV